MLADLKKEQVGESRNPPIVCRRFSTVRRPSPAAHSSRGWTLIELLITMTVMSVLALGAIPMLKTAVRRQKEQQLRDSLRTMREAIKEFRRDTVGMQCGAGGLPGSPLSDAAPAPNPAPNSAPNPAPNSAPGQALLDPRSTVVVGDCTIFGVDNPDHYPPDLDTLVKGVKVVPRQPSAAQTIGSVKGNFLDQQKNALAFKTKIYLREVPVDPMTGQKDWVVCSSWEAQDAETCGGKENVFDVRSRSQAVPLDGKGKYSDW